MTERRKFKREGEEKRREQLIAAMLDVAADGGLEAATVREVAARAGVTQGLIRHYFATKEELIRETYRYFMTEMTEESVTAIPVGQEDPKVRLAAFVLATLRPPVMEIRQVTLWSSFLNMSQRDPQMAAVHEETYLAYRGKLELLISALPGCGEPARARSLAISVNAVLDGLWLEGAAYPTGFAPDEPAQIGLSAVSALVGVDLNDYWTEPPNSETKEKT